jgi:hypothetical protein
VTASAVPRWQRAYAIAMCALIGGALAFALCDWAQWPRVTYLPLERELVMHAPAGAVAVPYWGVLAWLVGGAACGALIGAIGCAIVRRPLPDRALLLLGAWAITAVLLAGSYYTFQVWPW